MPRVLIIHGPNLDMLGSREEEIYGRITLKEINRLLEERARKAGLEIKFFQSNHEGEIVEAIGRAKGKADFIIINPAAYTHTSVAIRDALAGLKIPVIEVHLSNIYKREKFRHRSYIAPVCLGQICGFGKDSYLLALEEVVRLSQNN